MALDVYFAAGVFCPDRIRGQSGPQFADAAVGFATNRMSTPRRAGT